MPAYGDRATVKVEVARERARRKKKKPEPAPRRRPSQAPTPSGDMRDRTRAGRERQIRESKPASPDRADDRRSALQKRRDAEIVARNIRDSRIKVLADRRHAALRETIRDTASVIFPGSNVRVVARPGAGREIGATVGVRPAFSGAGRMAAATGIGIAMDPARSIPATGRGFRDALTGIPSSIAALITDPVGTAEGVGKDYSRRYGGINEPGGVGRTARRISKEGAAPELLDAAGIATATGASVGRALTAPAAAGRLGARAQRVATEARPNVRVSGGVSRPQATSPNLLVAAAQAAADTRRVGKNQGRVARADARGNRVGALQQEAARRGEVPARSRVAARHVARDKGLDLERMKREQRNEVDQGTRRALASLSKAERAGFAVSMRLGIPADPKIAVRELTKRRSSIVAAREAEGVVIPKVLRKTNDELTIIDGLIKNADKVFTPRLRAIVEGEQSRERRVAASDPGLDPVQSQLRRYAPQAAHLGITRADGESTPSYLRRVKKAAAEAGLARPGYFVSQKRPRAGNADRAIGGTRAVAGTKTYTGALSRTGREDSRAEVFEQGIARNIKRKWNWNRVADNFDKHSFEWGRNQSADKLLDELDRRGIDPESVALWNPRLYRKEREGSEGDNAEATGRGEEPVVEGLGEAVDSSTVKFKKTADGWKPVGLATRPEDFEKADWSVIPRAVYDEIHADTRPSGVLARGWDIAKGKQSRLILGLSPAWLQYGVASNALLSGLAGTGPVDLVKAHRWWKTLSEAEQAAIEPFIGSGAFHDSINQTKLGAARSRSEKVNQMTDAYRAMKTTPFMQKVGRGNPLDLVFRADAAQNSAFRKGVLYSQVKRDAYKRMGQNTKMMAGVQTRFMHTLTLGPTEQMRAIVRDQRDLERHAQHVNDFLGDYNTFSASERRGLRRGIMFYGFLRFSLRFAFMTMPIKHPIMSSIIAQLGRLQVDEVRKLLGGDELPWSLGKFYFTKDGKLKSVDLSRANPAMNAITNFRGPKDLLGFLPPIVGAVADQAYAKSGFKQREWRVEGENQPRKGQKGYGVENRVRIFLGQMLGMAAPYRAALNATQPGPKGDDTLLGSARPTRYVDPETVESIGRSIAQQPSTVAERLALALAPLVPRNDSAPELAASIRARNGVSSAVREVVAPQRSTPSQASSTGSIPASVQRAIRQQGVSQATGGIPESVRRAMARAR